MNAYLWTGIVISLLGVLCLVVFPRYRSLALLGGLCSAPIGLFDTLFTPEYWDPPRLLGDWLSIEGLLFAFGNGILIWLGAAIPLGSVIDYKLHLPTFFRRCLACAAIGIAAFAGLWQGGLAFVHLPVMEACLTATVIQAAFALSRRPDAWPFAITGSICFSIVFAVQLFFLSSLVPELNQYWSPAALAGIHVFGVPFAEVVWAFVFGAVHPLLIAYCGDVHLCSKPH
jgi:hypothetical protein